MATYINVHTHIFSANHVPDYVIGQNRWWFKVSLRNLQNWSSLVKSASWGISTLAGKKRFRGLQRILEFGSHGLATSQKDLFDHLRGVYDELGYDFKFVILPMDLISMGGGDIKTNLETQLHEIIMIRQNSFYANRLLPFVPVDPRNPLHRDGKALLKFVRKYIEEEGFIGIKLYPALGFFPFDSKLFEMYAWAIEKQIPIMTHTIAGSIHWQGSMDNWEQILKAVPQGFHKDIEWDNVPQQKKAKSRDVFQNNFGQPHNYELLISLLQKNGVKNAEKLKLCFGHFGMERQEWFDEIFRLIQKFPNLYADFSYVIAEKDKEVNLRMNQACAPNYDAKDKVLFGTDYFVASKEKTEDEILPYYLKRGFQLEPYASINAANFLKSDFYNP